MPNLNVALVVPMNSRIVDAEPFVASYDDVLH